MEHMMFNKNNRYITNGIQQEIPLELQLYIWNCVDMLKEQGQILDYLIVIELRRGRIDDIFLQELELSQEVPEYRTTNIIFSEDIVEAKIFLIDDGDHSTMLLAEEY
jgi:hypothetical protein